MIPCGYNGCSHVSKDESEHYHHWVDNPDTHPSGTTMGLLHGRKFEDYGPGLDNG